MNKRTLALYSIIALAVVFGTGPIAIARVQASDADSVLLSIARLSQTNVISPTNQFWEMLGQVDRSRAVADLRRLTGEEPICTNAGCYTAANRQTGSAGLRWATDYIYEELVGLGYSLEFRDWSREGWSDRNLIARKVGVSAPIEEVYLVAHVDGVQPTAEERFPAADDNASGAVDLLEVARVLSTFSFSRTVVLLFSTGEEHGGLGAGSYLDQLSSQELSRIKYAVNVDMVGYDGDRDGVMQLWPGDDPPSLALTQLMSETIGAYRLGVVPRIHAGCA